jgi:protein subunit release factor B
VSTIVVTPGTSGPEATFFARVLRRMYDRWEGPVEQEAGVHRLVCRSAFDEQWRRHTCFALVEVEGVETDASRPFRSYVLDPYLRAVDHRTGRETDDVYAVLDGKLDLLLVPGDPPQEGPVSDS